MSNMIKYNKNTGNVCDKCNGLMRFDEDYDLKMGEDGNYRVEPKSNASNLGLTDYDNLANNNNIKMNFNSNDFDPIDHKNSSFDFSQYNDDETKKEVVVVEKTNTVIVG